MKNEKSIKLIFYFLVFTYVIQLLFLYACSVENNYVNHFVENGIGIARHVEPADPSSVLRPAIPAGYDAETVLELGKCPGPGFEGLSESGLDGQGLGIAIIGGVLYTEHEEYQDNLVHYEEIGVPENAPPVDSASWAASVAVGKNCGVAPGASLYYIAVDEEDETQQGYIQALQHLIAINRTLPREQKIRAVVINKQFSEEPSEELQQAIKDAYAAQMHVIYPYTHTNRGCCFNLYMTFGVIYPPQKVTRNDITSDPKDPHHYIPYHLWDSVDNGTAEDTSSRYDQLHLALGARTFASADGSYAFFQNGVNGLEPAYIAGLYILAMQINSRMTPQKFYEEALQGSAFVFSGTYVNKEGSTMGFENLHMANPAGMIAWLQEQQEGDS